MHETHLPRRSRRHSRPVSSLYDFLTFFALLHWFHFGEAAFHTGWFLESLATQTLVLFVIRTAGRPWSNRPSLPLAITTLLVVAIGGVLPYTPVAGTLGLVPLPASYFVFVTVVVVTYLALVEVVKRRVIHRFAVHEDRAPLATSAHSLRECAPGQQCCEARSWSTSPASRRHSTRAGRTDAQLSNGSASVVDSAFNTLRIDPGTRAASWRATWHSPPASP